MVPGQGSAMFGPWMVLGQEPSIFGPWMDPGQGQAVFGSWMVVGQGPAVFVPWIVLGQANTVPLASDPMCSLAGRDTHGLPVEIRKDIQLPSEGILNL